MHTFVVNEYKAVEKLFKERMQQVRLLPLPLITQALASMRSRSECIRRSGSGAANESSATCEGVARVV